ncbi:diuretic hormone class 2 [Bicyclus anynana]|uniref:Diuretic hormone class 2 n=1 Tax=Bicyclus anynana TaxID=110368 RepID=A0ABM3LQ36_BICAN|nr:diuretic hormone class 2 [Bicyclus anynana]
MMRLSCLLTCCLLGAMLLVLPATGYPSPNNYFREDGYEPEEILSLLNRLNDIIQMERKLETYKQDISRTLMTATNAIPKTMLPVYEEESPKKVMPVNDEEISNEKRDLDMGLNRGFSGAVQAKHLIGMTASRFAGGPGRRRRAAH